MTLRAQVSGLLGLGPLWDLNLHLALLGGRSPGGCGLRWLHIRVDSRPDAARVGAGATQLLGSHPLAWEKPCVQDGGESGQRPPCSSVLGCGGWTSHGRVALGRAARC